MGELKSIRPGNDIDVEAQIRQNKAVELRAAGLTYQKIAEQLGYANKASAHTAVTTSLRRANRESAAEYAELELQRLERLQLAFWTRALQGDVKAAEFVLRIMERRAKMLGIDAAEKHLVLTASLTPETLLERAKEIEARIYELDRGRSTSD